MPKLGELSDLTTLIIPGNHFFIYDDIFIAFYPA